MEIYRYHRKDNPNYRPYKIFTGMNYRAWNRKGNYPAYKNIGICEEWDIEKRPFNEALADFVVWAWTHGYNDTLTLDRIDNSKGYSPDNCRWTTPKEQARNRTNNTPVTVNGVQYASLAEAVESLHREEDYKTIETRIYRGMTAEEAFNEPIIERGQNTAKPITVNGVQYNSITEACKALNLNRGTVSTYQSTHHITAEEAINHYIKETQT